MISFVQNIGVGIKKLWFPLFAACLSFGLLQIDGIERSFLGAPDREMLQAAFKLRDGVARGSGDPILWLDLDFDTLTAHAKAQGRSSPLSLSNSNGPSATMPRSILASALAYARKPGPTLVVLDVDISWLAPDPDGNAQLETELKAWSADPSAPMLVLAREVIAAPEGPMLVPTRFDSIVAGAPNIAFAGVAMLSGGGGVREFVASQCYILPNGQTAYLPSAVTFAEAAQSMYRGRDLSVAESRAASIKARVMDPLNSKTQSCSTAKGYTGKNGIISWHIGYSYPSSVRAATVGSNWPHRNVCALSNLPKTAARISVADIMVSPQSASPEPLCRRIVIIGGDNPITKDRNATPIGLLPGPIVLANAMRGHFDTGPILRQNWNPVKIGLQLFLLTLTVIVIVWVFEAIGKLRARLLSDPVVSPMRGIALFLTHPLCFKFIIAFATFAYGVIVTTLSLELGFWGLLSAPAYFATLYEAWKQINADRRAS